MKKTLITLASLTIVSLLSLGGYKAYEDVQDAKILPTITFKELDTFEYGDKVDIEKEYPSEEKVKKEKEAILIRYKDIIDEEASDYHTLKTVDIIQTDEVGEFKIKILATRREQEASFELPYKVEDTQKPTLSKIKNQTITEGDKFSFDTLNFSAKDPVDGKLKVKYKGEFDNNKPGEYKLTAYAKDKNNNKTEQNFKLIVEEKEEIIIKEPKAVVQNTPSTNTQTNNQQSSPKQPATVAKPSNPAGRYREDLAKDMFNKVIAFRKAEGNDMPLNWGTNIVGLANTRAKELSVFPDLNHQRPDGKPPITIWGQAVENIYIGGNVDTAMDYFKKSESHRYGMLGVYAPYDHLAVSVYEENGVLHFVQIFVFGENYPG